MSRFRLKLPGHEKRQSVSELLDTGLHGLVHSYDSWRGRGYLITEVSERLKVRRSAIMVTPPNLRSGQEVIFDLLSKPGGLEATNVRLEIDEEADGKIDWNEEDTGYDIERFVCDVSEEFVCVICRGVIFRPLQTPCEHIFCGQCVRTAVERRRLCPVCRKSVQITQLAPLHRVLQTMLDGLVLRCRYANRGCDEVVRIDQEEIHAQNCLLKYK